MGRIPTFEKWKSYQCIRSGNNFIYDRQLYSYDELKKLYKELYG